MSNDLNSLIASTHAIIGSNEAIHLIEQKENVEQALDRQDPSQVLDTSKAFLETIFKTILFDLEEKPYEKSNPSFTNLFYEVCLRVPLNPNVKVHLRLKDLINKMILAIANLRDDFGSASHGKDGYFENPIQMPEVEMIARFVDGIAAFLYRKHKESKDRRLSVRLTYDDCSDFNEWFDEEREAITINIPDGNQVLFLASEVLFKNDQVAYQEAFLEYLSWKEDEAKELTQEMEL